MNFFVPDIGDDLVVVLRHFMADQETLKILKDLSVLVIKITWAVCAYCYCEAVPYK